MRVLITGAFGNVGESLLLNLQDREHSIRCFDLRNHQTERVKENLSRVLNFETVWGDIRSEEVVRELVQDVDCIIHLAAIIPPASENLPELARAVNVGGTSSLTKAASDSGLRPKFIYASSIATYGHCPGRGPPKTAGDPQIATDVYTETKISSEDIIKRSVFPWTILRFGVVPPLGMRWIESEMSSMMFDIPLEQRIEFIHTRDLGLALANAIAAETDEKILLLGGGESCRMIYREFVSGTLKTTGIGMLPESAFIHPTCDEDYFHTDWMDTEESQSILQFQTRTFEDYLSELRIVLGYRLHFIRLLRPIIRRRLLSMSEHYRKNKDVSP